MPYFQIRSLVRDAELQCREGLNEEHVDDLAEALKAGKKLGPAKGLKDHRGVYVYDGWHRIEALTRCGCNEVEVETEAGDLEDARWLAAAANQDHGLKRTNAGKRRAVVNAIKSRDGQGKSDRDIANHVGVSHTFVAKIRSELSPSSPQTTNKSGNVATTTSKTVSPPTQDTSTSHADVSSAHESNGHVDADDGQPFDVADLPPDAEEFEPPLQREPGEDDDAVPDLQFPEDWTGTKTQRLEKAIKYLESRVIPAAGVVSTVLGRLFPHHGLPLRQWGQQLDSMLADLKRLRGKLKASREARRR